jgi:tripartite-type tricarboxylate transporter receptor subunit TctC
MVAAARGSLAADGYGHKIGLLPCASLPCRKDSACKPLQHDSSPSRDQDYAENRIRIHSRPARPIHRGQLTPRHRTHRRRFFHLAVSAAALPVISRVARAQTYPTRPVRIIVPFPPAGSSDILARVIAPWLSERLGQPFVIENRPGAATNIGTEVVVRALPDGYTLLMFEASQAINATLYDKLNFVFLRDIAPVACIIRTPLVMEVHPSVPAKTVPEFIAYAKANPGKINMASAGTGTPSHLFGELFKVMTGIAMTHVPYRGGGSAITDLLGGQVQVFFSGVGTSIEYISTGKVRALAVTTATRLEALPDVPTVGNFVPGYEASTWYGVGAPKSTPPEIVEKLNREINAAVANPMIKARLAEQGGTVFGGSPTDFEKLIADDTTKWARVIRAANIKPE